MLLCRCPCCWPVRFTGLHSTLFDPVKFAYLPQALRESELTGGNGMVHMGTLVAILPGHIVDGLIVATPQVGSDYVAMACLAHALAGSMAIFWS